MNTVSNYLSALREAMKAQGLDALVIPSADPHLSEYLPAPVSYTHLTLPTTPYV